MRFFGRVNRVERRPQHHATIAWATVDCSRLGAERVRQALEKAVSINVRQMAGEHIDGFTADYEIDRDGVAELKLCVTDELAQRKPSEAVYRALSLDVAGDDPPGIRLLDCPLGFEDGVTKGQPEIIAKIFTGATSVTKMSKAAPAPLAPYYSCGAAAHRHATRESAAWCMVGRETAKGAGVKKAEKRFQKELNKQAGIPNDPAKALAQLLARPIMPDSADMKKRAQAASDFNLLYHAGRQQLVDLRFRNR